MYDTKEEKIYTIYKDGEEEGAIEGTSKRNALFRWSYIRGYLPENAFDPQAYSPDDPVPGLEGENFTAEPQK